MTDRVSDEAAATQDILAMAEGMYRDVALDLDRTIAAVRAGDFTEIKAAQSAIRELRATALHVLEERNRVDKLRKQIAGQVGTGGELDFEGARAEIGRRLACLRNTGRG